MTRAPTIRPASLAEVTAIWAIEKLSFPSPWSRWSFLAELGQRHSRTLVIGPPASQPWQTWGYLIFWVVADEMHILNLAIHPDHRRRGLARQLLQEGLRQARALGVITAWLEVRPSNAAARALYASLGFKQVGRRPRYYDDTQEDALLLALFFEAEKAGEAEAT